MRIGMIARGEDRGLGSQCVVPDCAKTTRLTRGMCEMHYERWRKFGDPSVVRRRGPTPGAKNRRCSVEDCARLHYGRGLCRMHYVRLQRKGHLDLDVHHWRCPDGIRRTSRSELDRKSPRYRRWRLAVFERDNFTCQHCGVRGVRLHADHIKSWARHPELRYDVSNGRTLCVPCHMKTPTWGVG